MGLDSSVSPLWCSTGCTAPLPFQQSKRGPAHKSSSKACTLTQFQPYWSKVYHSICKRCWLNVEHLINQWVDQNPLEIWFSGTMNGAVIRRMGPTHCLMGRATILLCYRDAPLESSHVLVKHNAKNRAQYHYPEGHSSCLEKRAIQVLMDTCIEAYLDLGKMSG